MQNFLFLTAFLWGAAGPLFGQRLSDPQFNQLIITELLIDPGPEYEGEFIELYNKSSDTIQLEGLAIEDLRVSGKAGKLSLAPGDYAIACSKATASFFETFGKTVVLNPWPTLNNNGDRLIIRNRSGQTIFLVHYDESWYKDSEKRKSGYSLEMIDLSNSCTGYHNWSASKASTRATPGLPNSVTAINPDLTAPELHTVIAPDRETVILQFNETIHPESMQSLAIDFEPAVGYTAGYDAASLNRIILKIEGQLSENRLYKLKPRGVFDCNGNMMDPVEVPVQVALPADPHDLVINEILFNAKPGGVEFIEIYNRSEKTINLNGWRIAVSESPDQSGQLFEAHYGLRPSGFLVLTSDSDKLKADFPSAQHLAQVDLPALNNSGGYILLADSAFQVIDSVNYEDRMHISLLTSEQGVSLERVAAGMPSNDADSWQYAAGSAGFATPGRMNSQTTNDKTTAVEITVSPKTFSPFDRAGRTSTSINYSLDHPGYIANIRILDSGGRLIRDIAKSETVGMEGAFSWDGRDNHGNAVGMGYYVVYVEFYDLSGKILKFREKAAVGMGE